MTDLFAQQGITFNSAQMASTHPTDKPDPIPAGKPVPQDQSAAVLDLFGSDADKQNSGAQAAPVSAPQSFTQALAGSGNEGAGAAGVAPPQPPTQSGPVDLFKQEGIQYDPSEFDRAPSIATSNQDALSAGIPVPASNKPYSVNNLPPVEGDTGSLPDNTLSGVRHGDVGDVARAQQYAVDTRNSNVQLATQLYGEEKVNEWLNNPIGPVESIERDIDKRKTLPFAGGAIAAAQSIQLSSIAQKVTNKEPLSETEQATVDKYIQSTLEEGVRGYTRGGKLASSLVTLPAWLIEYASGEGLAGKALGAAAGEIASPTLNALVKIPTTAAFMPTQYVAGYGERQLNATTALTDKGALIAKQSTESPAMSLFMSYGFVTADVASAMAAPGINKYVVEPTTKLLSTPIVAAADKLPIGVQQKLYDAYKAIDPNASFSKLMTPEGYSSVLSAVGSFQLDKILRSSVEFAGTDEKWSDYMKAMPLNEDDLLVAGALTAIHGGISSSGSIMRSILQTKGLDPAAADEVVSQHSALERDAYVNKNLPLPQSEAPTLEQNAPSTILADSHETQGATGAQKIIAGDTNAVNGANPPPIQEDQSWFNRQFDGAKVYAEMWNDLQPIENLGKKAREAGAPISDSELSPAALSLAKSTPALIERQWTTNTTSWDAEGNQVVTGKGLKQIADDYDNKFIPLEPNRDTRADDMSDFRKAMTFIEDKTKGYSNVSDKDFNESQDTLSRLSDKYGEHMKWMEIFAKEYRDFDNRILHNLVTSGLKTQAWYDDTVGKREWYAPTNRVVEEEYPEDAAAVRGKGLGKDVNPKNIGSLKERKGSEREVIDPVLSSMRNSAIIIQRSMLNKVRLDTAKYAEYYPEQVKVKPPMLIRAEVTHNYDPKLRTKLEQVAEFLRGSVERVKAGDKHPTLKSNLGVYDPSNNSITLRAGTTEGTLTHEIGHMLDYTIGLKDKLLGDEKMKQELETLSEDRLRSSINLERTPEGKTEFAEAFERNPKKYVEYVKNKDEVIANFFDSWVNSPEQTHRIAPRATAAFESMIDKNPELAMLRQIEPSTQRATETIQKALLDFKGPKDSLPFYDNGKLKFLHMDPATAQAFKGLDQVQQSMVGSFFKTIGKGQARLLQFGATNNPYFIAKHFMRGAQSSYVNTPLEEGAAGFLRHFAIEIPKGIAAVIGKTEAYREWASSSGALRTYMDTSTEGIAKLHAEMFDHADMSKFLDPRNWAELAKNGLSHGWQTAKQVSDYAPRIAAYERLKDAGYSDLEAGYLSLEATGNYIRHGSVGKQINAYSPFFNDRLQGADRFLRAIKRDPAGYAMRAAALITMPQLLVTGYYLYAADDETRKEYLNLSDFRRGAAMNIKIGGQWIPFPRAFAPGYVFGALPEQAMIHFSGVAHPELKNFWLHMIGDTVNSLSPSSDWTQTIPPVIKAAIESQTNFSFFRNMPIFHGDVNKTAPENQYNATTSETAKGIASAANKYAPGVASFFKITPANIDNTAYDMAGHIGVYAQQLGDYAINTAKRLQGQPVNEKPTKGSDNPIYGPMMQPAPIGTASESFQEFHQNLQDLEQQHNRDKEATGKDKAEFERDNHQDIALYPTVARANTEVMHAEHEIRLITENPHLTGDQKAQQIAQRQQRIEMIVEGANNVVRQVKGKK